MHHNLFQGLTNLTSRQLLKLGLENFVDLPFVKEIDFSTLERVDKSFVTRSAKRRAAERLATGAADGIAAAAADKSAPKSAAAWIRKSGKTPGQGPGKKPGRKSDRKVSLRQSRDTDGDRS